MKNNSTETQEQAKWAGNNAQCFPRWIATYEI